MSYLTDLENNIKRLQFQSKIISNLLVKTENLISADKLLDQKEEIENTLTKLINHYNRTRGHVIRATRG